MTCSCTGRGTIGSAAIRAGFYRGSGRNPALGRMRPMAERFGGAFTTHSRQEMEETVALRDILVEAVGRLDHAGVSFGHGTSNAVDEAAWLVLHALGLPPTDLNSRLDRRLTAAEAKAVRTLIDKRIRTRKPAAYLTHEAWLGKHRFYVDERVIVPRSYIFEL